MTQPLASLELKTRVVGCSIMLAAVLGACAQLQKPFAKKDPAAAAAADPTTQALRAKVKTIVVIYAAGRSFDDLYGNFPGARGLADVADADGHPLAAYVPQQDRDGSLLVKLPPTWGGVSAPGAKPAVSQAQSGGLANAPFSVEHAFSAKSNSTLSLATPIRRLNGRFFEHQLQIDSGRNDGFAAWSDGGGLALGHYDTSHSALFALARQYVLADHFFQGAFGGSFLNYQYSICACAPEYPSADTATAKPAITVLESADAGHAAARLKLAKGSPAAALEGPPKFSSSGSVAPANYFGDAKFYAVNTMQPAYQPSGNAPPRNDAEGHYADPDNSTTLPPQNAPTIGDRLTAKNVGWAWYASGWNAALLEAKQPPKQPVKQSAKKSRKGGNAAAVAAPASGGADFQAPLAPFNFYARFDPQTHAEQRAEHLKDAEQLAADSDAGSLPPVVFYQPPGHVNQHPGFATVADDDAQLAGIVAKLQAGPQWSNMMIVIIYADYGGAWDHLAPPKGDLLGPGTRVPALIVSPFAKMGTVDHTQYDTESILRLLTRRFDLEALPGMSMREHGLAAHAEFPMGDLTNTLALTPPPVK